MALGARIKLIRTEKGLRQQDICAKVPGLSQQSLDRLENRDSRSSEHVVGIADALGVSIRWLQTGEGRSSDVDWPLQLVDRDRWDKCFDEDRGYVQAAMNAALDHCDALRKEAAQKAEPAPKKAPAMAADGGGQTARRSLTIKHGDNNPHQRRLPLSTVDDPFTAEPGESEAAWYERLERDKTR